MKGGWLHAGGQHLGRWRYLIDLLLHVMIGRLAELEQLYDLIEPVLRRLPRCHLQSIDNQKQKAELNVNLISSPSSSAPAFSVDALV
jgi:hypothetical protein